MWNIEIPNITGFYWFYGILSGNERCSKELEMVEIVNTGKFIMIIAHNEFFYNPIGVWGNRIQEPELP